MKLPRNPKGLVLLAAIRPAMPWRTRRSAASILLKAGLCAAFWIVLLVLLGSLPVRLQWIGAK